MPRPPITRELVQDVARVLREHGHPEPDHNELGEALRDFTRQQDLAARPPLRLVGVETYGGTLRPGHLLTTGRARAGKTTVLIDLAQERLADGGKVFLYAHDEMTSQRWMSDVKIIEWLVQEGTGDSLAALASATAKVVTTRAQLPPGGLSVEPVLLAVDELPNGLADDDPLVTDLVTIIRCGAASGVSLAVASQDRILLPNPLRVAMEANATITQTELGARRPRLV